MDGKLQASVVLFPGGGGPQIGGCDDVTSRLDGVEKKKRNPNLISKRSGQKFCHFNIWKLKCQLDVTDVSIAYLVACSTCFGHHYAHHQELKNIIQWLLSVVFRALVFELLV